MYAVNTELPYTAFESADRAMNSFLQQALPCLSLTWHTIVVLFATEIQARGGDLQEHKRHVQ
jgi:hypothetical protein